MKNKHIWAKTKYSIIERDKITFCIRCRLPKDYVEQRKSGCLESYANKSLPDASGG